MLDSPTDRQNCFEAAQRGIRAAPYYKTLVAEIVEADRRSAECFAEIEQMYKDHGFDNTPTTIEEL